MRRCSRAHSCVRLYASIGECMSVSEIVFPRTSVSENVRMVVVRCVCMCVRVCMFARECRAVSGYVSMYV